MNVLEIARARVDQLRTRAVVVPDQPGIFSVEGPGASDCLQGLFTNDVVKPGPDSLSYGAFLTPKGAIITDAWLLRTEGPWLIVVDAVGRQPTADLLRRQLPPRLARVTDRSAELAVLWLLGARRRNGLGPLGTLGDPPAPGRLLTIEGDGGSRVVATGPRSAPFAVLVVVPSAVQEAAAADLVAAGAIRGDLVDLRIARVVAGVPTLGEEIDDRTFPRRPISIASRESPTRRGVTSVRKRWPESISAAIPTGCSAAFGERRGGNRLRRQRPTARRSPGWEPCCGSRTGRWWAWRWCGGSSRPARICRRTVWFGWRNCRWRVPRNDEAPASPGPLVNLQRPSVGFGGVAGHRGAVVLHRGGVGRRGGRRRSGGSGGVGGGRGLLLAAGRERDNGGGQQELRHWYSLVCWFYFVVGIDAVRVLDAVKHSRRR